MRAAARVCGAALRIAKKASCVPAAVLGGVEPAQLGVYLRATPRVSDAEDCHPQGEVGQPLWISRSFATVEVRIVGPMRLQAPALAWAPSRRSPHAWPQMAVRDALNSAMDEEMARDDKVLVGGRPRWAAGARRGRGSAGRQREG